PAEQDAALDVPADSAGEDHLFQVAAFLQQVVEGTAVGDAHDILLNDGTVIEDFGDVMAGGADELYASLKCLVVRLGAYEGRQERVVDVDDAVRVPVDEFLGKDLHVASEHDQVRTVLSEESEDLMLGCLIVV